MSEEDLDIDYTIAKQPSGQQILDKTEQELRVFCDLLEEITTVDARLKLLWKQIYENALIDRRNAYVIWTDLYVIVCGKAEQHVVHGDHLAKYMERMEKANTQLLKLAELVHKAKEKQETEEIPSSRELFKQLKNNSK